MRTPSATAVTRSPLSTLPPEHSAGLVSRRRWDSTVSGGRTRRDDGRGPHRRPWRRAAGLAVQGSGCKATDVPKRATSHKGGAAGNLRLHWDGGFTSRQVLVVWTRRSTDLCVTIVNKTRFCFILAQPTHPALTLSRRIPRSPFYVTRI